MPCRDDPPPSLQETRLEEQLAVREAMLCQVLKFVAYPDLKRGWDEKETGVSFKEFEAWYKEHQAADNERKQREADKHKGMKLAKQALGKLSRGEREALLGYADQLKQERGAKTRSK